ncbi:MAG: hypothetical protein PUG02_07035 [Selenomonadaceae bacterium]|nr:hypothetical protein [Selenomonadaceae bacterium]
MGLLHELWILLFDKKAREQRRREQEEEEQREFERRVEAVKQRLLEEYKRSCDIARSTGFVKITREQEEINRIKSIKIRSWDELERMEYKIDHPSSSSGSNHSGGSFGGSGFTGNPSI